MERRESAEYTKGYVQALKEYATHCSGTTCESCPIETMKGTEMNCLEFMRKFPDKFASIMDTINNKERTYLSEYRYRFPDCNMSLEDMADNICRKAVFEGSTECEGGDCEKCWNTLYSGDRERE